MDDVIIPSQDFEEGLAKLKDVLQVASRNGLRINWSKCQKLLSKVQFLGYIIQSGIITPGPEKIKAVKEFPIPHDKKAIPRSDILLPKVYKRVPIHCQALVGFT